MRVFPVILAAATLIFFGIGCKNTYKETTSDLGSGAGALRANSRVYVAMAEDGLYKKESVTGSGRRASLAIQDAFKRHTRNVLTGRMPETLEEAIGHARELNYEYVALPTVLKWEDRATEWSGRRDRLQLKIDVVATQSGEVLKTTTIDGIGKWMTDGDAAPQDLLAEPVDKFVRSLFRMTYTPSALRN